MTAHVPAIPNFLPIGPVLFGMFLGWRSHRAAVCPALGVFLLVYFAISFALLIERLFVTTSAELIGALHFIANRFVIDAFLTVAVETLTLALIKNAYRISFFNKLIRIPEQRAYERHEVVLKLIRYLHILHRSLQKIQRYARP
jgi:hypothetical protein